MQEPNSLRPNLTIETRKFLDQITSMDTPPIYDMKAEDSRKFLLKVQEKYDYYIDAKVIDSEIFTSFSGVIPIRIVRPSDIHEKLPVILYIHGGGWVMGDRNTHLNLIKKLAVKTKSVVIFPEYSRSPESKYPTAITECYTVLDYIHKNPEEFNINPYKIAIAGDSVGGNMATVITMKAKKENGPNIKFQTLLYPVTDANMKSESYESFKNGPWLTQKAMQYFWNSYLNNDDSISDCYISPINASKEELSKLPPAIIITAENDVLRDEGEEYGRKLSEAGVSVTSVRINGTIHDFMILNGISETEPVQAAFCLVCKKLRKILHNNQ